MVGFFFEIFNIFFISTITGITFKKLQVLNSTIHEEIVIINNLVTTLKIISLKFSKLNKF